MQDRSDLPEIAEPVEGGIGNTAETPAGVHPTSDLDVDAEMAAAVLAEVLPGVAVLFGEAPPELELDLIDFGLVSAEDRLRISTVIGSIGVTATVGGNLGSAFASAQGLYRLSDATRSLLNAGGTLAIKDGANLGTVITSNGLAQARFVPVATMNAAGMAAAIGPALTMVAIQMQLSEITGLVRTNISLTTQVLTTIRNEQWAELTGLAAAIDEAVEQAREIESVPSSLWDTVAGKKADLRKQRRQYQLNVGNHVRQLHQLDTRGRREYLETNAEAVLFDVNALLTSVKAWTGYQALHAARARAAGPDDAGEARLVVTIARETRKELDSALSETTSLVDSLTRELRINAELPGPDTLPLTGKRRDSKTARQTSARLLDAIKPLAEALHPPAAPLDLPDVVCAPEALELEPYLRILRWFIGDDETFRALGFPDQLDAVGPIGAIFGAAMDRVAAVRDQAAAKTLVAVTNRRIITADTNAFLQQGEMRQDLPIDRVRYVRTVGPLDDSGRSAIDLITRDENIRWFFQPEIANAQVGALAAVLAESMTIPDAERDELQRRRHASIEG